MRNEKNKVRQKYNLDIIDRWDMDKDEWPHIHPTETIPQRLVPFELSKAADKTCNFAHFFLEDYRFERLWNRPERYIEALKQYAGCIAPDFSMYTDMPVPIQIYNSYRSKALGSYWQSKGIDVIPVLNWTDRVSWKFCLKSIPKNSTVAVSSVGVKRDDEARQNFVDGIRFSLEKLTPKNVVWYGSPIDIGTHTCNIIYYRNNNNERMTDGR